MCSQMGQALHFNFLQTNRHFRLDLHYLEGAILQCHHLNQSHPRNQNPSYSWEARLWVPALPLLTEEGFSSLPLARISLLRRVHFSFRVSAQAYFLEVEKLVQVLTSLLLVGLALPFFSEVKLIAVHLTLEHPLFGQLHYDLRVPLLIQIRGEKWKVCSLI